MLQFQLLLDQFFTYTKGYACELVKWDLHSPFLGQSVYLFNTQYTLMP